MQFLAVKKAKTIKLIPIKDIRYIKGAGIYTELYVSEGHIELHDKTLESLEKLLPSSFQRIHKSYILCWHEADKLIVEAGGNTIYYLKNGELLPVGRSKYKEIRHRMI